MSSRLGEQKIAAGTKSLAELTASRLNDMENLCWLNYSSQVVAGKAQVNTLTTQQVKAIEARNKKLDAWTSFMNYDLNKPLYLDMPGYIQSLSTKTKPWDIFSGLLEVVESNTETLKKIKKMEAEK